MPGLRTNSRKAHPIAWDKRKEFNRLRRLTQQALRAKDRGDETTMERLAVLLGRMKGTAPLFQSDTKPTDEHGGIIQKGVSGIRKLLRRGGDR